MISSFLSLVGRDMRPTFKLAIDPSIIAAGVSAAGSLLGSGISSNLNSKNRALTREGWSLQQAENEKNRQYQSSEWDRQFGIISAYNDPAEEVKRLINAGINPQVAMQNTNTTADTNAAPSNPSPTSSGFSSPIPMNLTGSSFIGDVANSVKSLVGAVKDAAEIPYVGEQAKVQLSGLLEDVKYKSIRNELEAFTLQVEKSFAVSRASKGLEKLQADIVKAYADSELALKNGHVADAEEALKRMQTSLAEAEKDYKNVLTAQGVVTLQYMPSEIQARISELRARAHVQNETARDLQLTREDRMSILSYQAELTKWQSLISNNQFHLDQAKFPYEVNKIAAELRRLNIINEKEEQDIKLAAKRYDLDVVRTLLEAVRTAQGFLPNANISGVAPIPLP